MPRIPRRSRWLLPLLVAVVAVVIGLTLYASIYTDLLWFRSVGFSGVFTKRLRTQLLLFVLAGALMATIIGANVVVAYRLRPPFRPLSPEQQNLERYRTAIEPYHKGLLLALTTVIGLLTASSASSRWRTFLLWRNGQPFGSRDPQFHRDVSYFAFTYPFQRFVLGFLFTAVVLSLVVAAVVHYLFGGLRLQTPGEKTTPGTRAHLSVLLGIFVLLKSVAYYLDRFGLAFSPRGIVTGPSYTDVNAVLPAKTILAIVAFICALLFFANVVMRGWLLPAVGLGLLVLCAVVIGGIYPAIVQQFRVKPSEADKESPYIARMITATRTAYGIRPDKDVATQRYEGSPTQANSAVRADSGTLSNIRLLDPSRLRPTWQQLQGFKNFYAFPDTLDIDRYTVGGTVQEQVVGVRDVNLEGLTANQSNWINSHLVYTHGYGFVAAPSNAVASSGTPNFSLLNIPQEGDLTRVTQPRVYFGENSPAYSIVGNPNGKGGRELDYSNTSNVDVKTTYSGKGGVDIGSQFRRLLYAVKFREKNILLSNGVNADSRILYVRNPRDRVQKVAPWLTLDGDPYPAVVGGRILWIIDGYTTTNGYPYSKQETLGSVTRDTLTASSSVTAQPQNQVNYIRNSVKATVDAYDGTVRLYQWDAKDPVLKTWMKAFPGTVQPRSAMSAALVSHVRYPEDLFKVQRDLLTRFHVTDPHAFYAGTDFWKVPDDPTRSGTVDQPPYYLTLQLPGASRPGYTLTSALVGNNRPNLAAFLAVDSDAASGDYGRMTLLTISGQSQVDGPAQAANRFESLPKASIELTQLRNGGSTVTLGNLLTLPLGGSFLYVEPVYVASAGTTSFPQLQRLFVEYNGKIAYEPTLTQALDSVFGVSSMPTPSPGPTPTGPSTPGTTSVQVKAAIADAQRAYDDGQSALRRGDFTAYGAAQTRLAAALRLLAQLSAVQPSPSGARTPTPSPGPSRSTASPTPSRSSPPGASPSPAAAAG